MNKNTLKAIAKRIRAGEKEFTIGEYTYYANYECRTVIHYCKHIGGPQITYFDELGL